MSSDLESSVLSMARTLGRPTLNQLVNELMARRGVKFNDAARTVYVMWKQGRLELEDPKPPTTLLGYMRGADSLWLWADMPGVDEQSVKVDLADGVLSIEGHVSLKDYENLTPVYTEYNVGNFVRRLSLSDDIDAERIKARIANGVLEIELPKAERLKPRSIPVSAS